MMISAKRFAELCKMADRAVNRSDLKTLALINQDDELRSTNAQFIARDGKCWVGFSDQIKAEKDASHDKKI